MQREFQRIAIVNRGEAAMRFIHAAHEYNQEHGESLRTIAFYTDPDRYSMFVREADEAVHLGAALVVDPATGQHKSSYVDYGKLEQALAASKAEAAWVGWGFVAEHAEFADLCLRLGIVFIGPSGDVMRRLGDKITSKLLAEKARIPVAAWSGGPVETLAEAQHHAERLGYPLFIKATAGCGGHGIRRVDSAAQLAKAFEDARSEAYRAFGNPTVFLERLVGGARHVEVQIIADHFGNTWAAGVRDCTIQRRHRKVLEEAPSPVLSAAEDRELREAAIRLSKAAGYQNAGTVEFLFQPEGRRFTFMEMSTHLQVEHPVTECTTGLDLVKLQIQVARGGRLEGEPPGTVGHAIEVRLNAEDPGNGFAPSPGRIDRFRIVSGPGVRVDTGVTEGDSVPPEFDSLIAKIVGYGRTRQEAAARLRRTLSESVIVMVDGASNRAFLLDLLSRADVQGGHYDTGWLDRLAAAGSHLSRSHAEVALVQAAIESYGDGEQVERAEFYESAARGRPQARSEVGRNVELRYRGNAYSLKVHRLGQRAYRITADGARIDATLDRLNDYESWLTFGERRCHIVSVTQGLSYRIEVNGVSHKVDRDDGGMVRSPAPAVVVSINVQPGDTVAAGAPVAVLEAMKMEMQVVAPFAGKVRQVLTTPYVQVGTGVPLLQIEPEAGEETVADTERVKFKPLAVTGADSQGLIGRCRHTLGELKQLMLGFDVDPAHTSRLLADWTETCEAFGDSDEIRHLEDEILNIFVDICALFQRQPGVDPAAGQAPSAETYLFSYLRMLETRGEGLPEDFVAALRRALGHYGIESLERSRRLEETMPWISKSHQRSEQQVAPIMAVLERRLRRVETLAPLAEQSFRTLLNRMIACASELFPSVGDLAREVRYRFFDQPLLEQARKQVYGQAGEHLLNLAINPQGDDRRERVRALVECPQPLVGLIAGKFATAGDSGKELMLEVLASRYYRIRNLDSFRTLHLDGRCLVTAEYDHEGRRIHMFSTWVEYSRIPEAAKALLPLIEKVPEDHDVVMDFFAWHPGLLEGEEKTREEVQAMLGNAGFPRPIRRIVTAVSSGHGHGIESMQHFTFRPTGNGYQEEVLYRGIHPMIAKRLHLWRLKHFKLERLPSVEEIYLLHAVAHENPKDERLIACGEIRDLTPVRDETGRIVQLPHLERIFTEAVAAMRHFQFKRPPQKRLFWNRIMLYMWPAMTLTAAELQEVVLKLAPAAEGLGIEQVVVRARIPSPETGELRDMVVRVSSPGGSGVLVTFRPAANLQPMRPLTEYTQKVVRMRQRGMIYPYELVKMLTPSAEDARSDVPPGDFVEYDLDENGGKLVPVDRPYGENQCNIIAGVIRNYTPKYPEGMKRVILFGDPSRDLGALAEPECRRINAAMDLAERLEVPLEWFPISAGARISMQSGVENMDWIARVLRRIIEFTQAGHPINLVIDGINVGAQPYWNAEATMLMHTKGILIMTPKAAMVLTGKRALDYSGSVSAEDNQGIGGYDRIMGSNGQAQYFARNIDEACQILLRHYEHAYVAPGERFPRRAVTSDPFDRDVRRAIHSQSRDNGSFGLVGEIFSDESNPGRKRSFDIRRVMQAAADQDHKTLERWAGMRAAETAVIWDAHLGGYPVCLIGIESHQVQRLGFVPADGPDQWTAGTLFPQSSKKIARAINGASNNRPVVLLANLSGFDGSPESMRRLQLEYGAEIGRSVVNFKGPMVFCVISRYHGGAYVVFSRALNEDLEVAALEGTYASVIGGAPAAAVVFAGEVEARARKDARLQALNEAMAKAEGAEKSRLRAQIAGLHKLVHSEKLGEVADEFDGIHTVQRALRVGALHQIVPPPKLRPYLIDAVERGVEKVRAREEMKEEGVRGRAAY